MGGQFNKYVKKLLTKPPTLSPEDLNAALSLMIEGEAHDIEVAAFLTALRMTELDHSPGFVAAAAQRIFQESHRVDLTKLKPTGYVDIVGTGGDGQNTFNVSTTAAIIAAGIGLDVCKHGGKASTSTSGAGDMLKCLGVDLFEVTHENAHEVLAQSKFGFLFAPVFHPMMKSIAPLRKDLGIPTIFNIMGPLLNPAPLKARIIGVYDRALGQVFAEAVRQINRDAGRPESKALIVWGTEGLDEISPAGKTEVWHLENEQITHYTISPDDFGLPRHPLTDVASGTPAENAEVVWEIVDNKRSGGDPILDYVLMNTAALAYIEGTAKDFKHGVELARQSIASGEAKRVLQAFIKASNSVDTTA
ncbi:anthranilate phosphoribosyltransferase [Trichomonascus vanleenenianus]|uniref:anthranilate phosphoribosyltransferase n=1 Tax=Trichomonascus vanleenenianus TaxID=2268995 RepID=UPI003ECA1059